MSVVRGRLRRSNRRDNLTTVGYVIRAGQLFLVC